MANFGHDDCDCNDGRVGILWGTGDGTFQPTVFYPSGGYDTVSILIQDGLTVVTNLCQDPDCDWPNGSVCVNGACYDSGGINPYSAAVGDLNGDGCPDVVVANQQSSNGNLTEMLGVLLAGSPHLVLYDPGGPNPQMGAVADLNLDGKPDIVAGTGNGTGVLLAMATARFSPRSLLARSAGH